MHFKSWFGHSGLVLFLSASFGCASVAPGAVVMGDGFAGEATVLSKIDGAISAGVRVSVGQVRMSGAWREAFGRTSERYFFGGVVRGELGRFYFEPSLGAAYYAAVDTPEELEGAFRVGVAVGSWHFFAGVRRGFGNGHDHAHPTHNQGSGEVIPEGGVIFTRKW